MTRGVQDEQQDWAASWRALHLCCILRARVAAEGLGGGRGMTHAGPCWGGSPGCRGSMPEAVRRLRRLGDHRSLSQGQSRNGCKR